MTELPLTPPKLHTAPPAKEMWETLRGLALKKKKKKKKNLVTRQHKSLLDVTFERTLYIHTDFDDAIIGWKDLRERYALVDMKISTLCAASTLLGAFAYAAPSSALDTRQFQVAVIFHGADERWFLRGGQTCIFCCFAVCLGLWALGF